MKKVGTSKVIGLMLCSILIMGSCSFTSTGSDDQNSGSSTLSTKVQGKFLDTTVKSLSSTTSARTLSRSMSDYKIYYYHAKTLSDFSIREESDINSDGTFSLSIPTDDAFIAFLIDPSQQYQKVVGVIGIGTGTSSYWEAIDTSKVEGDINLGTIQPDVTTSEMLISENSLDDFGDQITDFEEVRIMAKMDDAIRWFKNRINNPKDLDIKVQTSYVFNMQDRSRVENQFSGGGGFNFSGYQLFAMGGSLSESDTVELYPPSGKTVSFGNGSTFDVNTPVSNNWYVDHYEFGWAADGDTLIQETVPGYWPLEINGTKIGEFAFDAIYPVDSYSQIGLVHPSVKVNTYADSDRIDSIEIKWYISNGDQGYEEISPSALSSYIREGEFHLELSDFSSDYRKNYRFSAETTKIEASDFDNDEWHLYDGSASGHWAEYIGLGYMIFNDISTRFAIRTF